MTSDSNDHFDIIVIGAGQGGGPLAGAFAKAGKKSALIERQYVGGTCINYGCTPTKTIIASGRIAHLARRGPDYGVNTGNITIDMKKVRNRKRDIVDMFRSGSEKSLKKLDNLDLIYGHARFADPTTINIDLNQNGSRTLTADHIVINTGTRPYLPSIDGLTSIDPLDNASIMELDTIPEHLIVLGGSYIGLEFGQLFRRLGADVTILQKSGQLLPGEDEDVAEEIRSFFEEEGVDILLNSEVTGAGKSGGKSEIRYNHHGAEKTVSGSHVLVAVGRLPNTDDIGADKAGLTLTDRGHIKTNNKFETDVKKVYAIGDVKGGPAFTHISYDDYRILKDNLLNGKNRTTDSRLVPYTLFTDPQLGRVGLSEKQAEEQGGQYEVAKLKMGAVARALETDETRGFMKALVDPDSKKILGAAMLGIEGGELMNMIQIAMMGNLPWTALKDGAFAHPTLGESLNNLFSTLD